MSFSYEDMLREAAARQKANDAANRELINKKKTSEYEQKKRLIEEHKKLSNRKDQKPIGNQTEKPVKISDLLSSYKIPKKKSGESESFNHQKFSDNNLKNHSNTLSVSSRLQTSSSQKTAQMNRNDLSRSYSSSQPYSSSKPCASTSTLSQRSTSSIQNKLTTSSQNIYKSTLPASKNITLAAPTVSLSGIKQSSTPLKAPSSTSKNSTSNMVKLNGTASVTSNKGNEIFDILSGAKHDHKTHSSPKPAQAPAKPKQLPPLNVVAKQPLLKPPITPKHLSNKRGPTTPVNGSTTHTSSFHSNVKSKLPIQRPPPASFEEMMKIAQTNVNGGGASTTNPPPPKPKLPRDPPPSAKGNKHVNLTLSSKQSLQKDSKKLVSNPQQLSKNSSVSTKKCAFPQDSTINSKSQRGISSDKTKARLPDRLKEFHNPKVKNPERFKNDYWNSSSSSSTNRPVIPSAKKPFNPLAPERFMPSVRNKLQHESYNRIPQKRPRYDDYDDEDDSMDDFIDDDEPEDYNGELRKVLRGFCRSDETVWRRREQEIDLSQMNAKFHDIDAEERRSYKIARMEDIMEEQRGSKAL